MPPAPVLPIPPMIELTRINDVAVVVNADHIEFIESTPDTVVSFTTGRKLMVKENVEEVIGRVIAYKRSLFQGALYLK